MFIPDRPRKVPIVPERPRSFDDVIGHTQPVALLRRTLRTGRIAGAYLFAGPSHVGKKTVAAIFAAALNCERKSDDACGECLSCRKAFDENHPDIRFVRPEGATFRIDQVREVGRQIALRPLEGRYKVFVLTDVEKMRPEGANALLKTLEEPPGAGLLILVTTNPNALLPTIRSRCQTIKFLPMPTAELTATLVERGVEENIARRLAIASEGRPGWALERIEAVEAEEELPPTLRGVPLVEAFRLAEEWAKDPAVLDGLLSWYRDLLLVYAGGPRELLAHRTHEDALRLLAQRETYASIRHKMRAIMGARYRIQRNINASLTMEALALKLLQTPLTSLPWTEFA